MYHIAFLLYLDMDPSGAEDCIPEDAEKEIIFSRVHAAIKTLLHIIPM